MINNENMVPAIICDAHIVSQVAIIQELGKLKIPIYAISNSDKAVGFYSKYIFEKHICKSASHTEDYIRFIIKKLPKGVIFCSNDPNAEIIAKNKDKLINNGFKLIAPDKEIFDGIRNKDRLYITAKKIQIRVPKCYLIGSVDELLAIEKKFQYPFIIKATKLAGGVYRFVRNHEEIVDVYEKMRSLIESLEWKDRSSSLMVQEWIDQRDVKLWNFNGFAFKGNILSFSMGERVRTNISSEGIIGSTLLHGRTAFNEKIYKLNKIFVENTQFSGIFESEWSENNKTSETYLYDFNPRPSGNIRWAFKSGANLVGDYYRLANDLPLITPSPMKKNINYYKIFYEVNDFFKSNDNPNNSFNQRASILKENICAIMKYNKNAIDIFDINDPLPTIICLLKSNFIILFLKNIIKLFMSIVPNGLRLKK
ncbi:MAG: hypothetical protein JW855_01515 [Gammaproteobacteria bacterium]|nr:hypothetical protein [Gammaproteobacteria bacterium]